MARTTSKSQIERVTNIPNASEAMLQEVSEEDVKRLYATEASEIEETEPESGQTAQELHGGPFTRTLADVEGEE